MDLFKRISGAGPGGRLSRLTLTLAAAGALLLLAFYLGARSYSALERRVSAKKKDVSDFSALRYDYLREKTAIDVFARKAYSSESQLSTVALVEGICKSVGVKEKISSLKPLEEKDALGYRQKDIEVRLEKMDLNQLVNLLYQVDRSGALLVVKEFSMKSRFEDPNLLDVTFKLALLSKAA